MAVDIRSTSVKTDDVDDVISLFGKFDENIRPIETAFAVNVLNRDDEIKIAGSPEGIDMAEKVVRKLLEAIGRGEEIDPQRVSYLIGLVRDGREGDIDGIADEIICINSKGKPVRCKTSGQKEYVDSMSKNELVFGIGPAGTGKTYLAIALAVQFLRDKRVDRIVLTRPAVEAGEKLGYLPGDLQQKIDPYLRPLYDALYDILGNDIFQKYMESGIIEVAPLAYMRGRTLDNSFIILDEAQNTTPEQMKMLLTRFGYGSRVVVTGDVTQIDLGKDRTSGLKQAVRILRGIDGIDFVHLSERDVVRHRLVKEIIKAYARYSEGN